MLIQGLSMKLWLACNSLCRPGWLQTPRKQPVSALPHSAQVLGWKARATMPGLWHLHLMGGGHLHSKPSAILPAWSRLCPSTHLWARQTERNPCRASNGKLQLWLPTPWGFASSKSVIPQHVRGKALGLFWLSVLMEFFWSLNLEAEHILWFCVELKIPRKLRQIQCWVFDYVNVWHCFQRYGQDMDGHQAQLTS